MANSTHNRWTQEEDDALRKFADKGPGWDGWARLLDGRSYNSICKRRKQLGIQFDKRGPRPRPKAWRGPKPAARPKPKLEIESVVVVPGVWTPEQDTALLKAALDMARDTGHSWQDCTMRVCEIVRASREGEAV